jgi:hypothetical protein
MSRANGRDAHTHSSRARAGIVIDAFGGLRDKKDAAEENVRSRCFVCNLDRVRLDQHGIGFDAHVRLEHNPRWYFFYLLHVRQQPRAKLTGQEAYVLGEVRPSPRTNRTRPPPFVLIGHAASLTPY